MSKRQTAVERAIDRLTQKIEALNLARVELLEEQRAKKPPTKQRETTPPAPRV